MRVRVRIRVRVSEGEGDGEGDGEGEGGGSESDESGSDASSNEDGSEGADDVFEDDDPNAAVGERRKAPDIARPSPYSAPMEALLAKCCILKRKIVANGPVGPALDMV